VVVVAEAGLDDFVAALPGALTDVTGAIAAAGRLPRRGALIRCLAIDAPALTDALAAIWALARRTLWGLPPLALRKL
jgi:hypothetical protein